MRKLSSSISLTADNGKLTDFVTIMSFAFGLVNKRLQLYIVVIADKA